MGEWISQQWKKACDGEMILVRLSSLKTTPVYIPGGTTGLIQPLYVVVNAPFKAFIKQLAD